MMTIKEISPGWFCVYHNGLRVGDFASRSAVEKFCRNRGYIPR